MQISQEQLKTILKNKPTGTDNRTIVEGLIGRGYNLEGLDPLTSTVFREQKKASQPLVTQQEFEKPKATSFWGKARDVAASIVGGGKLAEGLGQAIAAPGVIKNLEDAITNTTSVQTDIIQRLQQKRKKGEDTSREMELLKLNKVDLDRLTQTAKSYTGSLVSSKEVVGSAARLAGTVAGGTIASKAAGLTGVGKATTLGTGALRGAGAGAITGGIEGGIHGAGVAAEQDRSTEEIILSGGLGATSGALLGGAIGTVTGGLGGFFKGRKLKKEKFYEAFVTPKETAKSRAQAIQDGRLEDPTLFGKAELAASKRDKQLAEAVRDVVKPKAKLSENVDAVKRRIGDINAGVEDYVIANKVPLNKNQIKSKLMTGKNDLDLVFASETNAEKTYNRLSEIFMKQIKSGDTAGVLEARKSFDRLPAVKKLLSTDVIGENARKELVLAIRGAANDLVATQLPKGNQFKASLMTEHRLFEVIKNLAEKNQSIVGMNRLQIFAKEYPVVQSLVAGLAAGGLALGGVGIGRSIVGSTD